MHPSEAPLNIQGILWRGQGQIKPRIWIKAHTLLVMGVTATGQPIFGTTYAEYQWEVTGALVNGSEPSIDLERPKYPTTEPDQMRQTSCTFRLYSEGGRLAATQTGAILRREDLEQATVTIYADIGGILHPWFEGRIAGMPKETAGVTEITATGYDWECLRNPVVYENFGVVYNGLDGSSQQAVGINAKFITTRAKIPVLSSHFCAEHGIVRYDGGGRQTPNVDQTDGEGIALTQLEFKNGAKLGIYRIKFTDSKNFTITYPSGQSMSGITSGLLGYTENNGTYTLVGEVGIRPEFWIGNDGTGAEIEIRLSWAAQGNPVAIAFHLIEKGLTGAWGSVTTGLAPMDIPAWTAAIRRFESFRVHVDATNSDNSVFENKAGNEPLSVAQLAQRVLDHVGCSLCLTSTGAISITIPYLDSVPAYPHSTADSITGDGITFEAADYLVNYLTVQYAHNGGSYGATTEPIDLRISPSNKIVEHVLSLPYFKSGIGRRYAQWAAETFARRWLRRQVVVSYSVHPGISLLCQTGDRITVESNTLPKISAIAEIFKAGKQCGTKDDGRVMAHLIQSREGAKASVCTIEVGGARVW